MDGKQGHSGDYNCISPFNGNKIVTGSAGGMFFDRLKREDADKVRKWSTQSREAAPWYQHEEIGYNYRMSNITIAGVIQGQLPISAGTCCSGNRLFYERYKEGFKDLPVEMNPYDREKSIPNFWLSCLLIDEDAMAPMVRGEQDYLYKCESGKVLLRRFLMYWPGLTWRVVRSGNQCICSRFIKHMRL